MHLYKFRDAFFRGLAPLGVTCPAGCLMDPGADLDFSEASASTPPHPSQSCAGDEASPSRKRSLEKSDEPASKAQGWRRRLRRVDSIDNHVAVSGSQKALEEILMWEDRLRTVA